jgi:hypothetical protein
MTRGKRGKLHAAAGEERIAAEEKGVRPLAHHGGKGCMDFLAGGGFEDLDFQADGAHSRFEVPYSAGLFVGAWNSRALPESSFLPEGALYMWTVAERFFLATIRAGLLLTVACFAMLLY